MMTQKNGDEEFTEEKTKYRIKRDNKIIKLSPQDLTDPELQKVVRRFKHTEYDRIVGVCAYNAGIWSKEKLLRVYIPIGHRNSVFLEYKNRKWKFNWNKINPLIEPNPKYFEANIEHIVNNFKKGYMPILKEVAKRYDRKVK